ncbi:molecular chaperone HscC [Dyella nitratireducens]|uniref:Molecular chaperone HscC n=1 Tax=Dyella nitratireducens TaxID=1849580 RepID=A0ABQ1G5W2_9GAMM|nr:molecular chaperone HscC [Dyella nitratireducens]GGA37112.1 molecular chaperone HscC [Dyella nitratireducens]GLQ41156.1 molecular chaperone HscC [Dyella nitratireducens]
MIVGIDLGTTHSLIGYFSDDGPKLFPNALGELLTPSVVSLDDDGHMIVGEAARDRLISHPQSTVATFKRWMGTSRETELGRRMFRPEELSALVLRSLIADAEAALGEKVEEAVISVPAYFSDAQRKATRAAGELAGIKVERLINEPTAAALAYGLEAKPEGSRFLVFDLGGGTFDVSVLETFEGVVEVHASAGDNYLGGEDFLDVLENACLSDLKLHTGDFSPVERGLLRRRLEVLKRTLSQQPEQRIDCLVGERTIHWEIDQDRFLQLAEPLMQRMRAPLERALRDARLQPEQLNEIVLVGGASRMPLVSRLIARMFGRLPLRHINPDEAIALGACVASGLKRRNVKLDEIILTDVCPYTLGVEVGQKDEHGNLQNGLFSPIIQRNSVVPISRESNYYPMGERQKVLTLKVYQGESPLVAKNIKLGQLEVPLNPTLPRADNGVKVRFTYDINGVLQVEATPMASGTRYELVLEQNPGILSEAEIRARLDSLSELKIHPRSKQENIAVLARAERLFEEHIVARDALREWIGLFTQSLESQDERLISDHRTRFSQAMDELERQL